MGASPQPLLVSLDLKGMTLGNRAASGSLWSKTLEAQAKRRWHGRKQLRVSLNNGGHLIRCKRPTRRILMKRRARREGSTRPAYGIKRRVRTLKKLVPNGESSMGLDGLFRETADYILALQMRLKVMQIMVKVLSLSGSDK